MGLLLLLVIGILVGVYLVLFSYNNTQQVSLNLLGNWYLHEMPIWQLVAACLAIGVLVAVLLLLPAQWRAQGRARASRRELRRAQALLEEEYRRSPAPVEAAQSAPAPVTEEPAKEETEPA